MSSLPYAKAKVALEQSDGDEKAAINELLLMAGADPELRDALLWDGASEAVYFARRRRNDEAGRASSIAPRTSLVTAAKRLMINVIRLNDGTLLGNATAKALRVQSEIHGVLERGNCKKRVFYQALARRVVRSGKRTVRSGVGEDGVRTLATKYGVFST